MISFELEIRVPDRHEFEGYDYLPVKYIPKIEYMEGTVSWVYHEGVTEEEIRRANIEAPLSGSIINLSNFSPVISGEVTVMETKRSLISVREPWFVNNELQGRGWRVVLIDYIGISHFDFIANEPLCYTPIGPHKEKV